MSSDRRVLRFRRRTDPSVPRCTASPAYGPLAAAADAADAPRLAGGILSIDAHRSRLPDCCEPARCRCSCGCRAHSHMRRCRLCGDGLHDAARGFLSDHPPPPTVDHLAHLAHLLPERRPRAVTR